MSWVLTSILPSDVVRIINAYTIQMTTLCRCEDCLGVLLIQCVKTAVHAGDRFTYRKVNGMLQVLTLHGQTMYLSATSECRAHTRTLCVTGASVQHCAVTPVFVKTDEHTYSNSTPHMSMRQPFTRIGGVSVCTLCHMGRVRVRAFFDIWRLVRR